MKLLAFILGCTSLFVGTTSLLAQSILKVNPVISPQQLASSFHYLGDLEVQDLTDCETQYLIFSASDNSFFRVLVTIDKAGSILTPQLQAVFDARPTEQELVTLGDGTKAYIVKNIPIIMMTSRDGRFDLKIGIGPPGDNIDIVKNNKNKQMFENGAEVLSRGNLVAAISEIYSSVATNYDQLAREKEARTNTIMSRLHPNAAPLATNAPAIPQSPAVRVPDHQPSSTPVDPQESKIPPWIYGVVVIGMGLIIGVWFSTRSKNSSLVATYPCLAAFTSRCSCYSPLFLFLFSFFTAWVLMSCL